MDDGILLKILSFSAGLNFALHLGQREILGLSSSLKPKRFDKAAKRFVSVSSSTKKAWTCWPIACLYSSTSLVRRMRFSVSAILMSVLSSRLLAYSTL